MTRPGVIMPPWRQCHDDGKEGGGKRRERGKRRVGVVVKAEKRESGGSGGGGRGRQRRKLVKPESGYFSSADPQGVCVCVLCSFFVCVVLCTNRNTWGVEKKRRQQQ